MSMWMQNKSYLILSYLSRLTAKTYRLHKPVTDWLETLPHSRDGLNM